MPYIHYPVFALATTIAVGQHLISLYGCRVKHKNGRIRRVKSWEIVADRLSKADWSWGCVSVIDSNGRIVWIADARRGTTRVEGFSMALIGFDSAD